MKFTEMKIDQRILKALHEMGFIECTDIQARTTPIGLEGKDLIGQAMTGSGKTAAFGIPLIQKMEPKKGVQGLVLTPTRELAEQDYAEIVKFSKYCNVHACTVYGGVAIDPQIMKIRNSEIVVGTPGRVMDHMQRGTLSLRGIKILVLDEGDRMLDMGFIDDIRKIISQTPHSRQTMLFSATMPDPIIHLARNYLKNPVHIKTQSQISEHLLKHYYYDVRRDEKASILKHLIDKEKPHLAIVFTATRRAADFVDRYLQSQGIESRSLHGGHTQATRTSILEGFHRGKPHILIATDVAARGLDIKNVSHIFNYDVPNGPEEYTHRVGRTARFGKTGISITLVCKEDHPSFQRIVRYMDIEKLDLGAFKPTPTRSMHSYEDRGGFGHRGGGGFRRPRRRY
ncbi:MAG: DEAD/DEAH box helicase [Candidatus Aenigmarchaeota archaeon]|nr:DEAD/DEAH box helicase [Candidatus Aenigmarchaeota archaeon]